MARQNKTKQVMVRLTPKDHAAFLALADQMDMNVSELVREMLRNRKSILLQSIGHGSSVKE